MVSNKSFKHKSVTEYWFVRKVNQDRKLFEQWSIVGPADEGTTIAALSLDIRGQPLEGGHDFLISVVCHLRQLFASPACSKPSLWQLVDLKIVIIARHYVTIYHRRLTYQRHVLSQGAALRDK